ncbi:pyridoxamine 5'-phosphate oxidase [Pusillimonas sp. DMV24BSW_D]|uniref:pyridoxamine 5'-phosphate oxidase n=1 Tax=Neopusillimonas aestuarii TaxID=2716226 RepID=UPI00140DA18D|nr:pyridoxamine 5'-phosphate oxidase [Pusillimonas sp. DMV24BSW_D]QIM48914.1 pyridoxamine 5'-phosphate oxidase [Pusillimonas sp. DMV24BSW_D]
MSIADIRRDYQKNALREDTVKADPFDQFQLWFNEALTAEVIEPTAMTLGTVKDGQPSSRIVLLKGFDARGLVFFTNYQSRKGQALAEQPFASALFFWPELERQVRFEGRVEQVAQSESDTYFHSRPLASRIGAWASPQSQPITREALDARARKLANELGDNPPRPEHWGGYRLTPHYVEFWQGRPSRLHDRIAYELQPNSAWSYQRLAP